jgi:serine/threonine protein kinase
VSAREAPFNIGDTIAEKYEVKDLLGRGGHAFVYECHDRFLDEIAAIKVIPDPPHRGEDLRRRAREEARLLYRLRHPNVVAVRDAGETAGMVYIVMEKLEGITLRTMLRQLQRLSLLEALVIARQIADGVSVAHAQNVVHRDLKPENVFILAPNNHVKVLDFGIAKFMGQGLDMTTEHDVLHGTVAYMSPEHLQGKGVTARSDVYQLGSILFEMLAGVSPSLYEVEEPTFEQLAWIQISRPTPELRKILPNVPASIEWLVRHATAKNPEQRFASMQAMRTALEAVTREYLDSVPNETLRIRMLVPRTPSQGGPGFSSTVPSQKQLEHLKRVGEADTERTSGPPFDASIRTSPLTPRPSARPDEAPGTAPSVTRTIPGSEKGRTSHGDFDDSLAFRPARTSWGKLALVAIPLGAVIGIGLNTFAPRGNTSDSADAAVAAPLPPVTEAARATAAPAAPTIPPPPVVPDAAPSATVALPAPAAPPRTAPAPQPARKRTTTTSAPTETSAPAAKAEPTKTEPPKSDGAKSDIDRMRERARKFEEEQRAAGKSTTP